MLFEGPFPRGRTWHEEPQTDFLQMSADVNGHGCADNPIGDSVYATRLQVVFDLGDSATGLYYLHARHYDPETGRFIQQDPILGSLRDPQSLNRYVYVGNNPTARTDPTGEFWNIVVGAVAGAVIGYGTCVWTTGGWTSTECGVAAGAGAVAGAVAGATFGASLALAGSAGLGTAVAGGGLAGSGFAFSGLAGGAAVVFAGAVSGAVAGAANYLATGGLTLAAGGQWEFSTQKFVNQVGFGIIAGAVTAGASYGIGKAASRLGQNVLVRLFGGKSGPLSGRPEGGDG